MNINDQRVIEYIEEHGDLCQRGTWDMYYARYGRKDELNKHFLEEGCSVIRGEKIEIDEMSHGKFLDTYSGYEDIVMMEIHGYGCKCGKYEVGELGYYIEETFQQMILSILGININVNLTPSWEWY